MGQTGYRAMKKTEKLPLIQAREPAKFNTISSTMHIDSQKSNYQINLASILFLHSKHYGTKENTGMQ